METDILYHGTKKDFPVTEIYRPAYFTDSRETAKYFAGDEGHVLTARLSAANVYEIDWLGCSWGGNMFPDDDLFDKFLAFAADGDEEELEYWEENGMCVDMFASMMEEDGYDITIFRNVLEEDGYISNIYRASKNCRIIPV